MITLQLTIFLMIEIIEKIMAKSNIVTGFAYKIYSML